jgi:Arm DNA-binding domain
MLTDLKIKNLKPRDRAYKAADRDGLYLTVTPAGVASFRYDYRINGRRETLSADLVVRELLAIVTADPNDIVQVRRGCCRHCWGEGFRYQYVDERELARARSAFNRTEAGLVDGFST